MPLSIRAALAALLVAAPMAAAGGAEAQQAQAAASAGPGAPEPKWMQRWIDDRAAMLDARLAGLKAGLRLTPDQEKLWGPFEAAVRDFAETRMTRMQGMMERAEKMGSEDRGEDTGGSTASPIERLDRMATRLSDVGAQLKKIADAGKPLYDSLDDQQKRMFGFLSHEMMMMGRGHHGMGPMGPPHRRDEEDDGSDEED